jgi:excisionase family DNA binding protein
MANEHMTIEQTASYLDVSEITVKRYIRENLIQHVDKDGQQLLVTEAVERYKKINEQFARR